MCGFFNTAITAVRSLPNNEMTARPFLVALCLTNGKSAAGSFIAFRSIFYL